MVTKTVIHFVVLAAFALLAAAVSAKNQNVPFACNMGALSTDQRKDLSAAIHKLIDAKPATKELDHGYEMRFEHPSDLFQTAATWISYERLCCPFFEFSINLSPGNREMTIQLTGPKGVKEFIDADLPALKQMTHGA